MRDNTQVLYEPPHIPELLSLIAFLYLLNVSSLLFDRIMKAAIIGPLFVGIALGPVLAGLISSANQETFIELGYVGLLLIVYEAGLTTDIPLLIANMGLSVVAATTGIVVPVALSMGLGIGYGYTPLQAFAMGAALCSTSLGTTLALLTPELRRTRTGSVLMSAALLDDVVGLVIAGITSNLSTGSGPVAWQTIVRPILVSLAFAIFIPISAWLLRRTADLHTWPRWITNSQVLATLNVVALAGFVAGAKYAGTSELFGAYLAGGFMSHVFSSSPEDTLESQAVAFQVESKQPDIDPSIPTTSHPLPPAAVQAYTEHISPIQTVILSPIFFASIGSALPVGALFTVDRSHSVIWKGIIYSLVMIFAKAVVGLWMLVWPSTTSSFSASSPEAAPPVTSTNINHTVDYILEPPKRQSAALLGIAMVARGEIALIVAQLARPILVERSQEPFAVVIWAVLLSTVGGAAGVGLLLKKWI